MTRLRTILATTVALATLFGSGVLAQDTQPRRNRARTALPVVKPDRTEISAEDLAAAVDVGAKALLAMQEDMGGDTVAEWPYEGVYRVGGQIPVGYRIGGTGICGMALLQTPGFAEDETRQDALRRATDFIIRGIEHPLMSEKDYQGQYDVRGWGYIYGLQYLLRLKDAGSVPDDLAAGIETAIAFYLDALQKIEIPEAGGWNYARGPRADPARPSPFMTGPALQVLFDAQRHGYTVDAAVVERALGALQRAKIGTGAYVYAGDRGNDGVPGAVGRMLVAESTLLLAGRGSQADVRAAIDAFIVHWDWLEVRRARNGTHIPPYSVAPYYFYFAHYYAAQAIELLPEREREEYRVRFREILFRTRDADEGTWNDRVFPRSANYGTAMSLLAILMPDTRRPATWQPNAGEAAVEGN
ncbi:MAG: hypothetical protein KDA25_12170 [Phycisphaerales bacterium]|nr:hypothetical protein [Phycisphaerales bacterium]